MISRQTCRLDWPPPRNWFSLYSHEDGPLAAAKELVEFRSQDDDVVESLLTRVQPQSPPDLAIGIVNSLRSSEAKTVGPAIVGRYATLTPATQRAAIAVLLSRPRSVVALLDGLDRRSVSLSDLSLDQRRFLSQHPDKTIRDRARALLKRDGALPNPDRQKVLDQLLVLTKQKGDAEAGKVVFTKQCSKCHVHTGKGVAIGPDLTGMAAHSKAELLTHIIDPSRNVEGNFRVYSVVTADGRVLNGLLAAESKTAIELFDAEGKKIVILREDIDELTASPKSLMPEGFEKLVAKQDISNLLEFLTKRGKFLPVDLRRTATIASDRGMFFSKQAEVERLIFPDWKPKTFQGVPFQLIDPSDGQTPNVIQLYGPLGGVSKTLPKSVSLPYRGRAKTLHLLSGVSGWGFPYARDNSVSMIVRIRYADGQQEDGCAHCNQADIGDHIGVDHQALGGG